MEALYDCFSLVRNRHQCISTTPEQRREPGKTILSRTPWALGNRKGAEGFVEVCHTIFYLSITNLRTNSEPVESDGYEVP